MRLAYVTQWFEPEPNIIKGLAFVRALQAAGHDVTVITGFPNYPAGRLYPGYRLRRIQHETIDGLPIVRLPLYPSHDNSSVRRSLNYLSFFLSAFIYLLLRRSKFDLAYVYHPPITVGLAAALVRIPFVLDVQDLWPDTIAATGMSGASKLVGPLGATCRFVYRRASAIIAQSGGIRRSLIERGVLAESLTSPRTAREFGLASNGANPEETAESLVMQGGDLAQDDVMHALDTGLYVGNLWYLNYSDRPACRITGMTRFATLWVEHGRIVAPVDVLRFDDTIFRMFGANLESLTRDTELRLDSSTYMQRSVSSMRLPGALLTSMKFTL